MKYDSLSKIISNSDRVAAEDEKKRKEEEERKRKEAEDLAQKEELRRVYEATQKKAAEETARQEAEKRGNKRKTAAELFAIMKADLNQRMKADTCQAQREAAPEKPAISARVVEDREAWLKLKYRRLIKDVAGFVALAGLAIGGSAGWYFGGWSNGSKSNQEVTKFLAEQADKATAEKKKLFEENIQLRKDNAEIYKQFTALEVAAEKSLGENAEKLKILDGRIATIRTTGEQIRAEAEKTAKYEVDKIKQEYEGRIAEAGKKLAEINTLLENHVKGENAEYKKAKDELESLKDERASLIRQMEELRTEKLKYEARYADGVKHQGDNVVEIGRLSTKNKTLEKRVSELEGVLGKIFGSVESATEKLKEVENSKSVKGRDPLTVDKELGMEQFGHLRFIQVKEGNLSGGTAADYTLFEKIRKYEPHIAISDRCIERIDISCNQPDHKTLDEIPPELKSYQARNVSLFGNKIKNLTNLEGARFRYLGLDRNEIEDTSGIKGIGEVKVLNLAYNKIKTLRGFENINGMEELLVYGNPLDYNDPVTKKTLEDLRAKGVKVIDKEPAQGGVR